MLQNMIYFIHKQILNLLSFQNVLNRFMNLHTALKEVAVMKNKTEAAGGGEGKGDG